MARKKSDFKEEKKQDFGDYLWGARKDKWQKSGLDYEDFNGATALQKQQYIVKNYIIPKKDYQAMVDNGMDKKLVFYIKKVLDSLPVNPNEWLCKYDKDNSLVRELLYKKGYIELDERHEAIYQMGNKNLALNSLSGDDINNITEEQVNEVVDEYNANVYKNYIKFLKAVSTSLDKLNNYETRTNDFYENLKNEGIEVKLGGWTIGINQEYKNFYTNKFHHAIQLRNYTIEEGIITSKFLYTDDDKNQAKLDVIKKEFSIQLFDDNNIKFDEEDFALKYKHSWSDHYYDLIVYDDDKPEEILSAKPSDFVKDKYFIIHKDKIVAINIDSKEEAETKVLELAQQVIDEELKRTTRKANFTPSRIENVERNDKYSWLEKEQDSKESDFLETLKFKGGQFGNWLNAQERILNMNLAYQSFRDIGLALGVDEKQITNNGELGIAFGSRGVAHALAHYEPSNKIINLTKMNGAGSLAHEWGHFFDNFLNEKITNSSTTTYLTNTDNSLAKDLVNSFKKKEVKLTKEMFDDEINDLINKNKDSFVRDITNDLARNFENPKYRSLKRSKKKEINGQVLELFEELKADVILNKNNPNYPTEEYINNFPKKLQEMFPNYIIRNEEFYKQNSWITPTENIYKYFATELKEIYNIEYNPEETRIVDTNFYKTALAMDNDYHGYWTTNHEMFARAFACYVEDKLSDLGIKNPYLTGHADYIAGVFGQERIDINKKFDELIAKAKELGYIQAKDYSSILGITQEESQAEHIDLSNWITSDIVDEAWKYEMNEEIVFELENGKSVELWKEVVDMDSERATILNFILHNETDLSTEATQQYEINKKMTYVEAYDEVMKFLQETNIDSKVKMMYASSQNLSMINDNYYTKFVNDKIGSDIRGQFVNPDELINLFEEIEKNPKDLRYRNNYYTIDSEGDYQCIKNYTGEYDRLVVKSIDDVRLFLGDFEDKDVIVANLETRGIKQKEEFKYGLERLMYGLSAVKLTDNDLDILDDIKKINSEKAENGYTFDKDLLELYDEENCLGVIELDENNVVINSHNNTDIGFNTDELNEMRDSGIDFKCDLLGKIYIDKEHFVNVIKAENEFQETMSCLEYETSYFKDLRNPYTDIIYPTILSNNRFGNNQIHTDLTSLLNGDIEYNDLLTDEIKRYLEWNLEHHYITKNLYEYLNDRVVDCFYNDETTDYNINLDVLNYAIDNLDTKGIKNVYDYEKEYFRNNPKLYELPLWYQEDYKTRVDEIHQKLGDIEKETIKYINDKLNASNELGNVVRVAITGNKLFDNEINWNDKSINLIVELDEISNGFNSFEYLNTIIKSNPLNVNGYEVNIKLCNEYYNGNAKEQLDNDKFAYDRAKAIERVENIKNEKGVALKDYIINLYNSKESKLTLHQKEDVIYEYVVMMKDNQEITQSEFEFMQQQLKSYYANALSEWNATRMSNREAMNKLHKNILDFPVEISSDKDIQEHTHSIKSLILDIAINYNNLSLDEKTKEIEKTIKDFRNTYFLEAGEYAYINAYANEELDKVKEQSISLDINYYFDPDNYKLLNDKTNDNIHFYKVVDTKDFNGRSGLQEVHTYYFDDLLEDMSYDYGTRLHLLQVGNLTDEINELNSQYKTFLDNLMNITDTNKLYEEIYNHGLFTNNFYTYVISNEEKTYYDYFPIRSKEKTKDDSPFEEWLKDNDYYELFVREGQKVYERYEDIDVIESSMADNWNESDYEAVMIRIQENMSNRDSSVQQKIDNMLDEFRFTFLPLEFTKIVDPYEKKDIYYYVGIEASDNNYYAINTKDNFMEVNKEDFIELLNKVKYHFNNYYNIEEFEEDEEDYYRNFNEEDINRIVNENNLQYTDTLEAIDVDNFHFIVSKEKLNIKEMFSKEASHEVNVVLKDEDEGYIFVNIFPSDNGNYFSVQAYDINNEDLDYGCAKVYSGMEYYYDLAQTDKKYVKDLIDIAIELGELSSKDIVEISTKDIEDLQDEYKLKLESEKDNPSSKEISNAKNETYSIKEMYNLEECAGWIFNDNNEAKCWGSNSNDLGLGNELNSDEEEDISDKLILERKIELGNGKYIYVGSPVGLTIKDIPESELKPMETLIEEIKASWKINTSGDNNMNEKEKENISMNNNEELIYANVNEEEELSNKDKYVNPSKNSYRIAQLINDNLYSDESKTNHSLKDIAYDVEMGNVNKYIKYIYVMLKEENADKEKLQAIQKELFGLTKMELSNTDFNYDYKKLTTNQIKILLANKLDNIDLNNPDNLKNFTKFISGYKGINNFTLSNQLLIFAQEYERLGEDLFNSKNPMIYKSFDEWKELGGAVKKNQHALISIVAQEKKNTVYFTEDENGFTNNLPKTISKEEYKEREELVKEGKLKKQESVITEYTKLPKYFRLDQTTLALNNKAEIVVDYKKGASNDEKNKLYEKLNILCSELNINNNYNLSMKNINKITSPEAKAVNDKNFEDYKSNIDVNIAMNIYNINNQILHGFMDKLPAEERLSNSEIEAQNDLSTRIQLEKLGINSNVINKVYSLSGYDKLNNLDHESINYNEMPKDMLLANLEIVEEVNNRLYSVLEQDKDKQLLTRFIPEQLKKDVNGNYYVRANGFKKALDKVAEKEKKQQKKTNEKEL